MSITKEGLLNKALLLLQEEIKIGHRDMAIEKGVTLRAIRKMKKENPRGYKLTEDALRFRKVMGELDLKIKVEISEKKDTYWLYYKDNKIIEYCKFWIACLSNDGR